jgi:hypothetical protein
MNPRNPFDAALKKIAAHKPHKDGDPTAPKNDPKINPMVSILITAAACEGDPGDVPDTPRAPASWAMRTVPTASGRSVLPAPSSPYRATSAELWPSRPHARRAWEISSLMEITSEQVRAARALIRWEQRNLAEASEGIAPLHQAA